MNIWIFNHYATDMYFEKAGRHQSLAKYLVAMGHQVTIFCANTVHNKSETIDLQNAQYREMDGADNVKYVFLQTGTYSGNGMDRIKNMYGFYRSLLKICPDYSRQAAKPHVIYASSVHPLTLVAGIKLAKKLRIRCVCEVRDLWPETFVELGMLKRNSLIAKVLYAGEKWIYKKADRLIFTMPGGADYIRDRGWTDKVPLSKVFSINNGVDLEQFSENIKKYASPLQPPEPQSNAPATEPEPGETISEPTAIETVTEKQPNESATTEKQQTEPTTDSLATDKDLQDSSYVRVIYAGSIRKANNVDHFLEIARIYKQNGIDDIKFIIYGDGDCLPQLKQKKEDLDLRNVVFKGRVKKECVPLIVSTGDINVVTDEANDLGKYGISWNKLFEYMASGKPTVANYNMGMYNLIEEYDFGVGYQFRDMQEFADTIHRITLGVNRGEPTEEYRRYCQNAIKAAEHYDFKKLAHDLEKVLDFNGAHNSGSSGTAQQ